MNVLCRGAGLLLALGVAYACGAEEARTMGIEEGVFGMTKDGRTVKRFTLTNKNGVRATLIDYGGILVSFETPDRNGTLADVTLGFGTVSGYEEHSPYFGAIVGRYANRIARGTFTLEGSKYTLATNDGDNHLHGGTIGFDKVIWKAAPFESDDALGVRFTYLSRDGEEGYPGNLSCTMTYTLTNANELKYSYAAETDKTTVVNLTQHSYWNLAGGGDILGHEVALNAARFTPVDAGLIPTGELKATAGTAFDFTEPHTIGERIGDVSGGYDHNFALNEPGSGLRWAARVYDPSSGRFMEVHTTEPGIQFYTGNFLDGSFEGTGGRTFQQYAGLCLETQRFPDSPNQPAFPSSVLRPGERYTHETVLRFSTR